jgi:hypothetical protein
MINLALIITPVVLATQPPAMPEAVNTQPVSSYDWESQSGIITEQWQNGSLRGTRSFVGSQYTIDDWDSD